MELVMHMEKSMTVMQDFPIGCKDGLTRRRCERKKQKKTTGSLRFGERKRFFLGGMAWIGDWLGVEVEVELRYKHWKLKVERFVFVFFLQLVHKCLCGTVAIEDFCWWKLLVAIRRVTNLFLISFNSGLVGGFNPFHLKYHIVKLDHVAKWR